MKRIIIILITMVAISYLSGQNPFSDGVHEVKTVDYKDGSNKYSIFGFRLKMDEGCSATYSYTEVITNTVLIKTNLTNTSWNWKDITSLEMDSVNHILRLNGREKMTCTDQDLDTKEVSDCEANDVVNVYFKTNFSLKQAINWVLQKVTECNGKARLIN